MGEGQEVLLGFSLITILQFDTIYLHMGFIQRLLNDNLSTWLTLSEAVLPASAGSGDLCLWCGAGSRAMDEVGRHCHICSSAPSGLIQLLHRRSFFCWVGWWWRGGGHDTWVYTES